MPSALIGLLLILASAAPAAGDAWTTRLRALRREIRVMASSGRAPVAPLEARLAALEAEAAAGPADGRKLASLRNTRRLLKSFSAGAPLPPPEPEDDEDEPAPLVFPLAPASPPDPAPRAGLVAELSEPAAADRAFDGLRSLAAPAAAVAVPREPALPELAEPALRLSGLADPGGARLLALRAWLKAMAARPERRRRARLLIGKEGVELHSLDQFGRERVERAKWSELLASGKVRFSGGKTAKAVKPGKNGTSTAAAKSGGGSKTRKSPSGARGGAKGAAGGGGGGVKPGASASARGPVSGGGRRRISAGDREGLREARAAKGEAARSSRLKAPALFDGRAAAHAAGGALKPAKPAGGPKSSKPAAASASAKPGASPAKLAAGPAASKVGAGSAPAPAKTKPGAAAVASPARTPAVVSAVVPETAQNPRLSVAAPAAFEELRDAVSGAAVAATAGPPAAAPDSGPAAPKKQLRIFVFAGLLMLAAAVSIRDINNLKPGTKAA